MTAQSNGRSMPIVNSVVWAAKRADRPKHPGNLQHSDHPWPARSAAVRPPADGHGPRGNARRSPCLGAPNRPGTRVPKRSWGLHSWLDSSLHKDCCRYLHARRSAAGSKRMSRTDVDQLQLLIAGQRLGPELAAEPTGLDTAERRADGHRVAVDTDRARLHAPRRSSPARGRRQTPCHRGRRPSRWRGGSLLRRPCMGSPTAPGRRFPPAR